MNRFSISSSDKPCSVASLAKKLATPSDRVGPGNTAFTGTIYAPTADFQLGGGGNSTYDFVGASITKSVKMNGHFNFHYDENLRRNGMGKGYIPTNWKEKSQEARA